MKIIINVDESNNKYKFEFDYLRLAKKLVKATLDFHKLDYDVSVDLSIVSSKTIKNINKSERSIDKVTDVLSFPNIEFRKPADFKPYVSKKDIDVSIIDMNSKTIFLGSIVLCYDKILSQAKLFGHSIKREFSFLVVHSLLHLLGYDHMTPRDEKLMFKTQDLILNLLKITR